MTGMVTERPKSAPAKREAADALDSELMRRQEEGMRLMFGMLTKEEADALDAELAYHAQGASSERAERQAKAAKMMCGMLTKEEADALDAELAHRVCIRERVL